MPSRKLKIAVGIATVGRREILADAIGILSKQTRLPDRLLICSTQDADVDEQRLAAFSGSSSIIKSQGGLPAKLNAILSSVADADLIVFFDDDFFADRYYIEHVEKIFLDHGDVVGVTGTLIADGVQGPGLSVEEALELIRVDKDYAGEIKENFGTYGCNMTFRIRPILEHHLLFDEKLPLYGWQEDVDFSSRIASFGRVIKSSDLRGVHLGTKAGRTSGVRLGYSQIVNPVYLVRKGTMPWKFATKLASRNLAANLLRSLHPEPWVDRAGRLKGNFLAIFDVLRGRISPEHILKL